jgi:hypothetical protein
MSTKPSQNRKQVELTEEQKAQFSELSKKAQNANMELIKVGLRTLGQAKKIDADSVSEIRIRQVIAPNGGDQMWDELMVIDTEGVADIICYDEICGMCCPGPCPCC